jgi:hypothetical protein
LIFVDALEDEVSKLKDKWAGDFEILSDFSKESIKTWTMDCVNLNNNIWAMVNEARDEFL